eukprot:4392094-Amphidinium_carterae.1
MIACERLQGQGVIVTDCKGAAVVANKLKLGLRRPRGRHSRVEHRIQAAIGDIEVQWMRSHQTAQQAEASSNLPDWERRSGPTCRKGGTGCTALTY